MLLLKEEGAQTLSTFGLRLFCISISPTFILPSKFTFKPSKCQKWKWTLDRLRAQILEAIPVLLPARLL
jgi:hypothetical protein